MKNKLKKQIIYLKLFIFIILSIALFAFCFGKENLFIGLISVLTVATMFGEDYTINPVHNTLYFIGIELFIGLGAYVATLNMFLGLIITLVVSFLIYFIFSYDTKPTKAVGFISLYLILLYQPIGIEQLPMRVIALIFGGIFIMVLYYILARYNFDNVFNKSIAGVIDAISLNLTNILEDKKNINQNYKNIGSMIKDMETKVHERLELDSDIVYSIYIKNLIVIYLKRVNYLAGEIQGTESNKELIKETISLLKNIKLFLENDDLKLLKDNLESYYEKLKSISVEGEISKYHYYNLKLNTKELLKEIDYNEEDIKDYVNEKIELIKAAKLNLYGFRKSMKMTSLRFNLAIKASITLGVGVFIVNYFKIYEGQWALYTISLLLLPYAEQSNKRAKERVIGTIIGAILFNLLFYFIQSNMILVIAFVFVCLYLGLAIVPYKIRCIFITLNALLMAGVMDPMHTPYYVLSEYRVFFIIVASLVVAIVMNLVFPYKIKDETNKAIEKYIELNKKILKGLIHKNDEERENIYILVFLSNHIWKKINFNNKELKSSSIQELLLLQNDFIVDLDFFIKEDVFKNNKEILLEKCKKFKTYVDKKELKKIAIEEFNKAKKESEKLAIILTYKLFDEVIEMRRLSNLICSN